MSNNFDEDWAIFPFDQTTDGIRWVKLIEEIDDLANDSDIGPVRVVENSVTVRFPQPRLTQNSFDPDDNGFSEQSLF